MADYCPRRGPNQVRLATRRLVPRRQALFRTRVLAITGQHTLMGRDTGGLVAGLRAAC